MVAIINPTYLEAANIQRIHNHFHRDSEFKSATLSEFFTDEALQYISEEIKDLEFEKNNNEIVYRRKEANIPPAIEEFLSSETFQKLSERITGKSVSFISTAKLHQYGHRDYRIIHDEAVMEPGYDLIIDLTPSWDDEFGGYIHYTDGKGLFYAIESSYGSLSIVERRPDWHYYIKYVNHYAKKRSKLLVMASDPFEFSSKPE